MNIIKATDYNDLSRKAANIISAQVIMKPNCVLGLATGSSPEGLYASLVERYKLGDLDFSQVKSVNLDEYRGLTHDNPQSYYYFMNEHLFKHINIIPGNTYVPDGTEPDAQKACEQHEQTIQSLGGIDLQLLGLGNNGHIGFNEPAEDFPTCVHTVQLAQSTIQANSRLFDRVEDVPTQAVTMGIGAIMKAKRVLLIAGPDKKEIVEKAFRGPVTPQVPASVLQLHRDATVIFAKKDA